MATLAKKNDVFLARFRFAGKEFKRSLKTHDPNHARAALRRIEDILHWLAIQHIAIPMNVDPGDFIVSGGTCNVPVARAVPAERLSLENAIDEYLGHVADSHRYTIGVHLRNLKKVLPAKTKLPVDQVTRRDLETFLQARLRERASTTVRKERDTIVNFFKSVVGQGFTQESPRHAL